MLVIGARGFVGRHVCRAAEGTGLNVVAASRDGAGGIRCDLRDAASVAACVEAAEPDLVVNMAGAASVASSWERSDEVFAVNAEGVATLLAAVAELAPAAHVLCVSSGEAYGEPNEERLPFQEDLPLQPVTPYGESKAAMEAACETAAGDCLRIAVIRAFNQFGPGQSPVFAASGFARQIVAAELAGAGAVELAIGNLAAARDFVDVRDSARAYLEISRVGLTGVYNLCSGQPLALEELATAMAEETPLEVSMALDPALVRPVDPAVVYGSPERLHGAIGWAPEIPLAKTVADLLDWWRAELAAA
jgi:GDP-4-dehydro-6-deoxy-D-mannose reductase